MVKRKRTKQRKVDAEVVDLLAMSDEDQLGSPIRTPIFCLKRKEPFKEFDEREDCYIIDFDPNDSVRPVSEVQDSDIAVIAEKGNVACRDYPHPRHACAKFPFSTTPHEKYCKKCYCYVCDVAAPCKQWNNGTSSHCHAVNIEAWNVQRRTMIKRKKIERSAIQS